MSGDRNGSAGFVCFMVGAALGAGLALIFAPQSGEETRKKVKEFSGKVTDDVLEGYEKVSKEAKKSVEQVKSAAENAIEHVKAFIDGAKEGLKKEIKAELKEEEVKETKAPAKKKA
jgi:gas vesicle protein